MGDKMVVCLSCSLIILFTPRESLHTIISHNGIYATQHRGRIFYYFFYRRTTILYYITFHL